jgi:hypothetical protein
MIIVIQNYNLKLVFRLTYQYQYITIFIIIIPFYVIRIQVKSNKREKTLKAIFSLRVGFLKRFRD